MNVYKMVSSLQESMRSNDFDVNNRKHTENITFVSESWLNEEIFDINSKTKMNETALHFAVQLGNKETVDTLLRFGAKTNIPRNNDGKTPLHLACCNKGSVDILKMLIFDPILDINAKDNIKRTGLHYAVYEEDIHMVKLLLRHGADPNARDIRNKTPLHIATILGCNRIIEELLTNNALVNVADAYGATPLHLAVKKSNEYAVRKFLEYAADPNISPLVNRIHIVHSALCQENLTILSLILKHSDNLDVADEKSLTPLEKAVVMGNEEKVKLLLKHNANPMAVKNLILTSVSSGYIHITKLLLDTGAVSFINTISKKGRFPLLEAVNIRRIDYLVLLLSKGADVNLKNKDGQTALSRASKCGFHEIEQFLSQPEHFSSYIDYFR